MANPVAKAMAVASMSITPLLRIEADASPLVLADAYWSMALIRLAEAAAETPPLAPAKAVTSIRPAVPLAIPTDALPPEVAKATWLMA